MPTLDFDSRIAETLRKFIDKLKTRLGNGLARVILFSSHAKGLADKFSDVDVLVVHRGDEAEVRAIVADAAFDASLKHGVSLEPITMTIYEFQKDTLFTKEIKKFEITLYP